MRWPSILVTIACCAFAILAYTVSPGLLEPGDGIAHYQISKWSWSHPALFLHHWGKPLFTFFSSPFAQLGHIGMVIFNCLLFCLSSYFFYRLCLYFKCEGIWFGILMLFAAPVYAGMVMAGMTEILFATLYLGVLLLFCEKRFKLGAMLFGFMFLARPEALVLLPLVGLFLLVRDRWAVPFLSIGLLIYSLLTYLQFGDALWFFHADPYDPGTSIYGHGEFFMFLSATKAIIGLPIALVLIASIVVYVIRKKQLEGQDEFLFLLLVVGAYLLVMLTHSYLWWQGIKGSMGLIRVMATVTPLVALISIRGWTMLMSYLKNKKYIRPILTAILSLVMIHTVWTMLQLPYQESPRIGTIKKALDTAPMNAGQRIICLDPIVAYHLNKDPYNQDEIVLLWNGEGLRNQHILRDGDILVWDSHFMRTEGKIALDDLKAFDNLSPIHAADGPEGYVDMGVPYRVRIFQVN